MIVSAFSRALTVLGVCMLLFVVAAVANAQSVPSSAKIDWVQPTVSVDGVPLTGANSLTGIEVYISTSPIADNSTMQPTATVSGAATTTTQTLQVANGSTLYVRLKAVNASGKSAFSSQVTKLVQLNATPTFPTSVTVTITINP